MTPPLVPNVKSLLDTSHFRHLIEQLSQEGERDMAMPVCRQTATDNTRQLVVYGI